MNFIRSLMLLTDTACLDGKVNILTAHKSNYHFELVLNRALSFDLTIYHFKNPVCAIANLYSPDTESFKKIITVLINLTKDLADFYLVKSTADNLDDVLLMLESLLNRFMFFERIQMNPMLRTELEKLERRCTALDSQIFLNFNHQSFVEVVLAPLLRQIQYLLWSAQVFLKFFNSFAPFEEVVLETLDKGFDALYFFSRHTRIPISLN